MSKDTCRNCGSEDIEVEDVYTEDVEGRPVCKEVVTCNECGAILEE